MTSRTAGRRQSGLMGSMLTVLLIPIVIAICAFGIDLAHIESVKSELHKATDAGALAGAMDLMQDNVTIEHDALLITGLNTANGDPVSNFTPGTKVTVVITPRTTLDPGKVQVIATRPVVDMFSRIFNRPIDIVTVSSIAGPSGPTHHTNSLRLFPIAVSWDTIPMVNGVAQLPLSAHKLGDTFSIYINSQQAKNGAFTSFTRSPASGGFIDQEIDQCLGLTSPVPVLVPSVNIGDDIYLNNGVDGQKTLAGGAENAALMQNPYITLPIIMGDPPYNQSRPLVDFFTLKVTSVTTNQAGGVVETITGTLVKGILLGGNSGPSGPGNPDPNMQQLEPLDVKLLQ